MTSRTTPPAEISIDDALVRALLHAQHADLAHLPLTGVGEGWDNKLFRLGERLAVRIPRREASARLIEHEQRWLPDLAPRLTLPVPVPVRIGRPGCGFPWFWSVVSWLPGESAAHVQQPSDASAAAIADDLERFLRSLHQPAPDEAPRNPYRGVPLADRTARLHEHVALLDGLVDRDAVLALWDRLLATPAWPGPPVWIHGDLHPRNLLVHEGRLSAVIDFGDLAAGDPATDLSVAWMLLPSSTRQSFRLSTCGPGGRLDDHTWTRARGWALALGAAYLAHSRDDGFMRALGRTTIDAALEDAADRHEPT